MLVSCEAQPHGSMIDATNHSLFAITVLHISWFVELMICKAKQQCFSDCESTLRFDQALSCCLACRSSIISLEST